jgi:hypothetical protein
MRHTWNIRLEAFASKRPYRMAAMTALQGLNVSRANQPMCALRTVISRDCVSIIPALRLRDQEVAENLYARHRP